MPETHRTARQNRAGRIDPDDLRRGYQVEVHDRSDDLVDNTGVSLVTQVITSGPLTYPQARELLIAIGRRNPALHDPGCPQYLAVAPTHRGGTR